MKEQIKEITRNEIDSLVDGILDKMNAGISLISLEKEFLQDPSNRELAQVLLKLKENPKIPDACDVDKQMSETELDDGDFTFPNANRDSINNEYTVALMSPLRDIHACSMGCQMRNEPFVRGRDYMMVIQNVEGRTEFSLIEEETGYFVMYKSIHKLFADWNIIEIIETNVK